MLIQKLNSLRFELSELGLLVQDIKALCLQFVYFRFLFSSRKNNVLAHNLIAFAFSLDYSKGVWFDHLPSEIVCHGVFPCFSSFFMKFYSKKNGNSFNGV